jgi:hypothetical protein
MVLHQEKTATSFMSGATSFAQTCCHPLSTSAMFQKQ